MTPAEEWMAASLCAHCSDRLEDEPRDRVVPAEGGGWAHETCEVQARRVA